MSYTPMNYTPVSGNYPPLPYGVSTIQNLHGTPLLKKHKCKSCNYQSNRSHDVKRHVEKKHPEMNNTNVQSYGFPMEIGNAGVVYQNNIQPPGNVGVQQPVNQPVVNPVYTKGYYQQPLINGSVQQDNAAQPIYHRTGYLGGYDQGGYLSDIGTQTSVQSDDEEPDILELLKGVEKTFLETLYIKQEYRDVVTHQSTRFLMLNS